MSEQEQTPAAEPETAPFKGETFTLNPDVSDWDTMEFLSAMRAASSTPDAPGNLADLVVVHDYALALIADTDRERFRAHARSVKASVDDLLEFILGKPAADAERPTERSSDSSDGPSSIGPTSAASSDVSDSAPTGLQLVKARPDLAVFLDQAASAAS